MADLVLEPKLDPQVVRERRYGGSLVIVSMLLVVIEVVRMLRSLRWLFMGFTDAIGMAIFLGL